MENLFPKRLAELRKENGFTQKEAAERLCVSAALLSHYEKGIRECGLSFICKAAVLYDVSCDYLLGVSDSRRSGFEETFDDHDTARDLEFRTATLFRAATMLNDSISALGGTAEQIRNYFALSIYRVAVQAGRMGVIPSEWITLPYDTAEAFSDALMDRLMKTDLRTAKPRHAGIEETKPACIQTVIACCEQLLQKECAKISNSDT